MTDLIKDANCLVLKYWGFELAKKKIEPNKDADKTSLEYIAWFIDYTLEKSPELEHDKLGRWVGFIQGVLACHKLLNVDEERNRTRPIFQNAYNEAWAVPAW